MKPVYLDRYFQTALLLLWVSVLWFFSTNFLDPFKDVKETIFYPGVGFLAFALIATKNQLLLPPYFKFFCILTGSYLALGALSILTAGFAPYEGALELIRILYWIFFTYLLFCLDLKGLDLLIRWTVYSIALIALLTFLNEAHIYSWPGARRVENDPIAPFWQFGDMMAFNCLLSFHLFKHEKHTPFKITAGLCGVLSLLGLWISRERVPVLALAIGFSVLLFLMLRARAGAKQRILWVLAGLILLCGGVYSLKWLEKTNWISFLGERYCLYESTLEIIQDRPLSGWGPGSFPYVYPGYGHRRPPPPQIDLRDSFLHPHNEFLSQASQTGLGGLLFFTCGILFVSFLGFSGSKSPDEARRRSALTGTVGILMAFVTWQTDTGFHYIVEMMILSLFAVLILKSINPAEGRAAHLNSATRFLLSILLLTLTFWIGAHQASRVLLQKSREEPGFLSDASLRWARLSYSLSPGSFDPLYNYAYQNLMTGHDAEAKPAIEKLYLEFPFHSFSLYLKGLLLLRENQPERAKPFFLQASRNAPQFVQPRQFLEILENPDRLKPKI